MSWFSLTLSVLNELKNKNILLKSVQKPTPKQHNFQKCISRFSKLGILVSLGVILEI